MRARVMLARFPGNNQECPASVNWYAETLLKAKRDPRISEVYLWDKSDTPITMVRNACLKEAKRLGVDFVLMLDNDMRPDCEPGGKPFWDTALDFLLERPDLPRIVAAPYVGPPPNNNIYVFRWRNFSNDTPERYKLDQYTREEAALLQGTLPAAALPTGVFLMNMNVFDHLEVDPAKGPFYYEWEDDWCSAKASTEDVTFTRDVSLAVGHLPGAGCFCAWDCWAAHEKLWRFGKPKIMRIEDVAEMRRAAFLKGVPRGAAITEVDVEYPKVEATDGVPA